MKRYQLLFSICMLFFGGTLFAQMVRPDTLFVSAEHVVHLVCPSEITDVEVSNPDVVYSRVLDNNPNMVGLLAFAPFSTPTSMMVVDHSGKVYVYFLSYREVPDQLVRFAASAAVGAPDPKAEASVSVGVSAKQESPAGSIMHSDSLVVEAGAFSRGMIGHIGHREFGVEVVCDRLYIDGDYLVFRFKVTNKSGISYELDNVTFQVERPETGGRKKKTKFQESRVPVKQEACMRTEPGEVSYSVFVFDKFSLRKGERFQVFFNEAVGTGTRAFELQFVPEDINGVVRK